MKSTDIISTFSRSLVIRGSSWKIKLVKSLHDNGTPCLGLCISDTREILIERGLPGDIFMEVLLHEYFHAVWFEIGLDDNEPPEWIEHIIITNIAKDMVINSSFWKKIF